MDEKNNDKSNIKYIRKNLLQSNSNIIVPRKRIVKSKNPTTYTKTGAGEYNFTAQSSLPGILEELKDKNKTLASDVLFTINDEKVFDRVLEYLKLCYLIAASNAGYKPQYRDIKNNTLQALKEKYSLDNNQMDVNTQDIMVAEEADKYHKDSKHKTKLPYLADEVLKSAIISNRKNIEFSEVPKNQ